MDREQARALALSQTTKSLKRARLEPGEFLADFCIHDDGNGNTIDDRLEIREMTGNESMQFEADKGDLRRALGTVLVSCILLPNSNEQLFNIKDRDALLGFGTSVLLPIQNRILQLSGLAAIDPTKTVIEEAKNA